MELIAVILVIAGVLLGEIFLYQKYGLKGLRYSCRFSQSTATEGDTVTFTEILTNDKALPMPWLKAELTVPRWLSFPDSHSAVTGDSRFVTGFFSVRSRAKVRREWKICCEKRGIYQVEHAVLVTSDLLGAVRLSLGAVQTGGSITVLPRRFTQAGLLLPRLFRQEYGEQPMRHSLQTDPCLTAGLREYVPGIPLNRIHWKASAHAGTLLARQEEPTAQRRINVLLSLETNPAGSGNLTRDCGLMEHTIRMCAQCLWELCREDWQVALWMGEWKEPGVMWKTQRGGGAAMYQHMMRQLAGLQLREIVPLHQLLRRGTEKHTPTILITPCQDVQAAEWAQKYGGKVLVTDTYYRANT